ncbi:probable protein phosphatase 2C 75 [Phragmites australis]|uniref:probable protein phosphatase 2C 75 n=1 Tax=Phragmites australis TaxID=29695 RepID=UPI002D76B8CB|nr:probable protein phosphatase 2C 75 [Phragmites australis]
MGSCLTMEQRPTAVEEAGEKGGEGRREEEAPGRIAGNGVGNAACLFTRQGRKGTNQDAMVVWENFNGRSDTIFCGVFDGHGPHGHLMARKVRDTLPLKLRDFIYDDYGDSPTSNSDGLVLEETLSPYADAEDKSPMAGQKEEHRELFSTMKESFRKAFRIMDKELRLHRNIDSICSGTTAVTLIKQGQDLIVGNLGDSRAVLGTRGQNGRLVAHQLTVDLKPDHPREARRIKRCNGRVFAHQDEPDVARLWLPNCNSPGLAMARAFGDFCLKDFGLISVPEVTYRQITEKDEFIVLATDGVWDVMSNQEVVEIVASCSDRSLAARSVVEYANQNWRFKYPTSKTDDCAVICLFLDSDANAGGLSGSSVTRRGTGSSPRMAARSRNPRSKRVIPEDAEDAESGDERSLEGFTRLNTLLALPKFGDTSPTKK